MLKKCEYLAFTVESYFATVVSTLPEIGIDC
jgi:hypothetical protein